MESDEKTSDSYVVDEENDEVDPIQDIIDYLVRCAKISFKTAHIDETEFGKHLAPYHVQYFENLQPMEEEKNNYRECVAQLQRYHSEESRRKRLRNRRYKAIQKLQNDSDYFSEKQMMFRNPLLYEQLVGQYLTEDEIRERDGVDNENLTFLSMILETVDRNQMRETKNEQMLEEDLETTEMNSISDDNEPRPKTKKRWGDFEVPDTTPSFTPEIRKQTMISGPERTLLREEFLQEMYSSFIAGRDIEVDYTSIDNDEQYDDIQQLSQDAEDRYFDSEQNDVDNLEQHMKLVKEYGRKKSNADADEDPLDEFMHHLTIKRNII